MVDNMTREQRSLTMSRIRKIDTKPELVIRRLVFARLAEKPRNRFLLYDLSC